MTESEAFAHFRLLRLAGEPKYALGPGFAEALAVDLLGRYPLVQAVEVAGRAHSLLVRQRRLEERAAMMGTDDAA
jgi:hypothetical protein